VDKFFNKAHKPFCQKTPPVSDGVPPVDEVAKVHGFMQPYGELGFRDMPLHGASCFNKLEF
jgi:hypothetical protein